MPIGPMRKSAGQRRHAVQVQKPTRVTDAMGGQSYTLWTTHTTVHGAVEPQPFVEGSEKPQALFQITVPYREDIVLEQRTANQRAIGAGRTFTVVAVIEPETKRRDLVLQCIEIYV